jgi:hypothetical protein
MTILFAKTINKLRLTAKQIPLHFDIHISQLHTQTRCMYITMQIKFQMTALRCKNSLQHTPWRDSNQRKALNTVVTLHSFVNFVWYVNDNFLHFSDHLRRGHFHDLDDSEREVAPPVLREPRPSRRSFRGRRPSLAQPRRSKAVGPSGPRRRGLILHS